MNLRPEKAFTLVEIMIVVSVIGLLALLAMPNIMRARKKTQINICINNQKVIYDAAMQFYLNEVTEDNGLWGTPEELSSSLADYGYVRDKKCFHCPADGNDLDIDYHIVWSVGTAPANYTGNVLPQGDTWWVECLKYPEEHNMDSK